MLGNRNEAAAYLAGIIDGEGCVYFHEERSLRTLTVVNTDLEILKATQKAYDTLGIFYTLSTLNYRSRQKPGYKRGWRIRVHHQQGFLDAYSELPIQSETKQLKLKRILRSYKRPVITRLPARTRVARDVLANKKTAAAYLAALIDGEGHVSRRNVSITNTDDDILAAAQACLDKLGIGPHYLYNMGIRDTGNFEVKRIVLHQMQAIERLQRYVPLQCAYKVAALKRLLGS